MDVERMRAGGRGDIDARRAALGGLLPPAVRRRRLALRAALRPLRRRARRAQRAVRERRQPAATHIDSSPPQMQHYTLVYLLALCFSHSHTTICSYVLAFCLLLIPRELRPSRRSTRLRLLLLLRYYYTTTKERERENEREKERDHMHYSRSATRMIHVHQLPFCCNCTSACTYGVHAKYCNRHRRTLDFRLGIYCILQLIIISIYKITLEYDLAWVGSSLPKPYRKCAYGNRLQATSIQFMNL